MRLPLLLALLLLGQGLSAQNDSADYVAAAPRKKEKERMPFKDRLWFGGGLGLNFGTVTAIQIDPLVGLHLDKAKRVSAGVGGSYWYYRDNRWSPPVERTAYGYRVFSRFRPIQQAFLHAEFLHLNAPRVIGTPEQRDQRIWVPHLLVGAGYVQSLGGGSSIYLQVLFDVLQDPNSIYAGQGPILGGGVGIGF